jgi:hypothetical protein
MPLARKGRDGADNINGAVRKLHLHLAALAFLNKIGEVGDDACQPVMHLLQHIINYPGALFEAGLRLRIGRDGFGQRYDIFYKPEPLPVAHDFSKDFIHPFGKGVQKLMLGFFEFIFWIHILPPEVI